MQHEALLREFETHRPALEALAANLERDLRSWLDEAGFHIHFVASRVKDVASLRHKLGRPDKTYRRLWDVTDLVGLRVATYFEDTIEDVARLIEERLAVDYSNSTDKLRFTDHGRFGYRSLHYVCAPPSGAPHGDLRVEIQIRTVLQHAWAEIEHDLGYKAALPGMRAADAVPELIRRRFSRIASLLEVADEEFVSIRRDLSRYQQEVVSELARGGAALPVDVVSLDRLAREPELAALDRVLGEALGKPLSDELFFGTYLVRMLRLAGLPTIDDVRRAVSAHGAELPRIVSPYFEFAKTGLQLDVAHLEAVRRGYGLLFIAHLAVLRAPDLGLSKVSRLTRLYHELDYPNDERMAHQVASGLIAALRT